MFKHLTNSKNKLMVFLVIATVLIISLSWWMNAVKWHNLVIESDTWYSNPELSRMEVRDSYNLAFKKIIMLDVFIFLSVFLLTSYRKKD